MFGRNDCFNREIAEIQRKIEEFDRRSEERDREFEKAMESQKKANELMIGMLEGCKGRRGIERQSKGSKTGKRHIRKYG